MCTSIGVDPLVGLGASSASAKRGRGWGLLGVGEFWVRVGTRVVGVCRRTRGSNGGFISVEDVRRILFEEDRRTGRQDVVEISEYFFPVFPHFSLGYWWAGLTLLGMILFRVLGL
jgi:hypothetical protein